MTRANILVRILCCLVFSALTVDAAFAQPEVVPETTAPAPPETSETPASETPASETPVPVPETSETPETENGNETSDEEAPPEKPRPRRPRRAVPPRARLPKGIFGADEEAPLKAGDTLLGGSVPALWELERSTPAMDDENLPSLLERDTVAPPVPGKVLRYAARLMQQYDRNADGVLQEDEWKEMPGAPQSIDLDGDRLIMLEELVRFLGLYGRNRTIHRPHPVERYDQPRSASGEFQWFKPVLPLPATAKPVPEADGETPAAGPMTDLSEEALEADDTIVDDATYEEIVAGRQVPAERKYHTAPEALRGVPAWFLVRDRNGDGQVSLLEFAPSLSPTSLALFGRLDKNGDGFITPDEVRTSSSETE